MSIVRLEILSSLVEALNIESKRDSIILEQEIGEGMTVREILQRLAVRYERFGQIVFDVRDQKLNEGVNIFFNGSNLELADGLATRLGDGDVLTFIAPIVGG